MFSSFTTYLFGKSTTEVDPLNDESIGKENELVTLEEDGGWLIVSNSHGPCSSKSQLLSHPVSLQDATHNISSNDALPVFHNSSNNCPSTSLPSSLSATSCLEDSWYITPPSCFTAGAPKIVHTSPLENLLIEHPSMSVYGSISGTERGKSNEAVLEKKGSNGGESVQEGNRCALSEVSTPCDNVANAVAVDKNTPTLSGRFPPNKCHKLGLLKPFLNSADVEKVRQSKMMHLKQLNRHNKAVEFQSVGKRHRRKDYCKNPSGKSNNRKY